MAMLKTFKYRLYPNKQQLRLLNAQLEECGWLYNHLLEERKTAWEERQESVKLYDQQATLPALKIERPSLATVHSQALQNVAVRIDLAFQAFFRRVHGGGEKPGYPRFRGEGRYDSLTFPQVPTGCKLETEAKRVRLTTVGQVKIIRPLEGIPKTATVTRSSTGKWYVCFSCECAVPTPLPPTGQQVGIDVGLKTFATWSTGEAVVNPRFFKTEEHELAKAQRNLATEEKGTPVHAHRRKVVARAYERTAWRRSDFAHQQSRRVVDLFDLIAVEDLEVNRMVHNHCLAKSIHDVAWSQYAAYLCVKAAWAGRKYVAVNPAYTSQNCSACGHRKTDLTLADRIYHCSCCGLVMDRDLNASLNILALGQQCLAQA